MTDWDEVWDRSPSEPITDDGLAYLRGQVSDRMADVAVGPLIARIDAVEAERDRLRGALSYIADGTSEAETYRQCYRALGEESPLQRAIRKHLGEQPPST